MGSRSAFHYVVRRWTSGVFAVILFCVWQLAEARSVPNSSFASDLSLPSSTKPSTRTLSTLVEPPLTILTYHNGPLLSGNNSIPVYIIWYGAFNESAKEIIRDFFSSFGPANSTESHSLRGFPTVSSWWNLTWGYVDENGASVSPSVHLAGESNDNYSFGSTISERQVEQLILNSITASTFPADSLAVYFVLTAEDVVVETFCSVCGSHAATYPSEVTGGQQLPYAWVGNSATQCASQCAWPFARAQYGPPLQLNSPNGNVGIDGMVINVGTLLAGMATNPFDNGYYQGDATAPLESASSCAGIYGPGASPGNPGQLFQAPTTNASFNALGVNNRAFLLPALWLPSNLTCTPPPLTN